MEMHPWKFPPHHAVSARFVVMSTTPTSTLGALEIGSLLGVFLFGVVSLQTFNYYATYPDDSWVNKTLIAVIWVCDLVHTVGVNYEVYRTTIIDYGRPDSLLKLTVIGAVTLFGALVTLLVQTFFSIRLAKLLPPPYDKIGTVCIAISTVRFAGAVYITVCGVTAPSLADFRHKVSWLVSATFAVSAAVDVAIAVSMLYYLVRQRGEGTYRISKILDRLITYTVRSGLITSISAIALVICFQTMPDNLVWMAVYAFVPKCEYAHRIV
ncbi:hypothetical protein M413DRAFT_134912 [Hebeloma cylindrosporum]|uniref:DUF6534 domain-containing protein n=1 Tax=Hebeloma cylindrosporum TaxID=76867 RepID=A0A0C2YN84_HEBCY|nr:hypothetical protein M413DRAFT_134912 [Hebeloma cylindrosporum h7]